MSQVRALAQTLVLGANIPWVKIITPSKDIWESPRVKENLTSVGFEPMTSGLDLPMLYQLTYKASTGAGRREFR